MIRATVSGSFHRHMAAIYDAVGELRTAGVDVLSPSNPRVVDFLGDFLFVASDKLRSVKLVQDRHLECIRASDFLWVVCPDGYTGASTSMEIGAAVAAGVPIFSLSRPTDITLCEYVKVVRAYVEVVGYASEARRSRRTGTGAGHVLIDPQHVIANSINLLGDLQPTLLGAKGDRMRDAERALSDVRAALGSSFGLK